MAILKKLKKGLKKAAKVAIPVGAALLAARAMKRKGEMKDFLATEGGDKSDMRDYGPFSKGTGPVNAPSKFTRSKTVLGAPRIDKFDDGNFYQGAKDGGRIGKKSGGKVKGCGIAKRGLGRAMKKGKR